MAASQDKLLNEIDRLLAEQNSIRKETQAVQNANVDSQFHLDRADSSVSRDTVNLLGGLVGEGAPNVAALGAGFLSTQVDAKESAQGVLDRGRQQKADDLAFLQDRSKLINDQTNTLIESRKARSTIDREGTSSKNETAQTGSNVVKATADIARDIDSNRITEKGNEQDFLLRSEGNSINRKRVEDAFSLGIGGLSIQEKGLDIDRFTAESLDNHRAETRELSKTVENRMLASALNQMANADAATIINQQNLARLSQDSAANRNAVIKRLNLSEQDQERLALMTDAQIAGVLANIDVQQQRADTDEDAQEATEALGKFTAQTDRRRQIDNRNNNESQIKLGNRSQDDSEDRTGILQQNADSLGKSREANALTNSLNQEVNAFIAGTGRANSNTSVFSNEARVKTDLLKVLNSGRLADAQIESITGGTSRADRQSAEELQFKLFAQRQAELNSQFNNGLLDARTDEIRLKNKLLLRELGADLELPEGVINSAINGSQEFDVFSTGN